MQPMGGRIKRRPASLLILAIFVILIGITNLFAEDPQEVIANPDNSTPSEQEAAPFVNSTGGMWFTFNTTSLNHNYVTNLAKIKREGDYRAEWRPDYVFNPGGTVQGIVKPRISGGLRTESRYQSQTQDVAVGRVGLYEGFARYRSVSSVKIEGGFIDLTGGYGQLFSPGNIWKTENVAGNPSAENYSTLSSILTYSLHRNVTLRLASCSNFTNGDFRLASPSNPDNPPTDFNLDTSDIYKAQEAKLIAERNSIYDANRPGGTYYSNKRQDDIYERPLYAGGDLIFAFDWLEAKVSAKGADHNSAMFGGSLGVTLLDSVLLYGEGNMTRGRSGLIPVAEGDRQQILTQEDISKRTYLRFADPVLLLIDQQEKYGFMPMLPNTQYQMLYDNHSYIRQALGGLQYTLPDGIPITMNAEYAYDGNGYNRTEYQTYRRAIHWATGPGLGRLSTNSDLPLDKDVNLYTYNPSGAQTLLNLVTGAGAASPGAAGAGSTSRMPVRLGQHYGLIQFMYQGNGGRDIYLVRYVRNFQDRSGYGTLYASHSITDSWTLFAAVLGSGGPFESEFNSILRNYVSAGAYYSW